jgi:hypothetical protein
MTAPSASELSVDVRQILEAILSLLSGGDAGPDHVSFMHDIARLYITVRVMRVCALMRCCNVLVSTNPVGA